MIKKLLAAALLSTLSAGATAAAPASTSSRPLELSLIRGGAVEAEPIVDGSYVYFPTGRVLATWDYRRANRPLRTGTTAPAEGVINSLVRQGNYLYATWRGYDGTSGVAVYSLAKPGNPVLIDGNLDYLQAEDKYALGLVVANGHLYLFDNNYGLFVGDLSNPRKPAFAQSGIGVPLQYNKLTAYGNVIYATGRSWLGSTVLDLYDVSNPTAPYKMADHQVDGLDSFSLTPEKGFAIGVGNQLSLFDLSNPQQMVRRGYLDIRPATYGFRVGSHYYSFGYSDGLDVWNIGNVDAPRAAGHLDISTLGGRYAVKLGNTALLQTDTDLVQSLDVSVPEKPRRTATSWLPGGVAARDVVFWRGFPLLLQPNYGMTVSDPATLTPFIRMEAKLPAYLQARSFEQIALAGNRAYLVAWGYGLITFDLSDPKIPRESGRLEFPFASVLDVKGNYAYLAKWTNGGMLGVADISNPEEPQLVWVDGLSSQPYRIKADGRYLYLAEGQEFGVEDAGGLRVYDLKDPAQPVLLTRFNKGCGSAFDLSVDSAKSRLYLACESGMQVINIAKPASPALIGSYSSGASADYNKVVHQGNRAWFADVNGLHELDVSNPANPTLRKTTTVGHQAPQRLRVDDFGRLWVLGGNSGVQVFGGFKLPLPRQDGPIVKGAL